jgi:hypothetical protein
MSYEVVLSDTRNSTSIRLPTVCQYKTAFALAEAIQKAYPDSLVEIAHEGIRTAMQRKLAKEK